MNMQEQNPYNRQSDPQDAEQNKTVAAVAYILFFLPLLAARDSRFAMYHANQGLLLLLATIAGNIVLSILWFVSWLLYPIFALVVIVYLIFGIMNAVNGKMQPLPFMPNIEILK